MAAGENDRFQRWQKIAIDQLGYTVNLVLAITIALIGYCFSLLRDKDFTPGSSAKCAMLLSLVALSFSGGCGLVCTLNRLRDFRGTARRAGNHPSAPEKEKLDGLGVITWGIFYAQLAMFAVGVVALAVVLFLTYGGKLA